MLVTEIMSKPAISVGLDDSLSSVMDVFLNSHVRFVLVEENRQLFGVIERSDVLKVVSPYVFSNVHTTRDLATLNRRVHEVVRRKPIFLYQTATSNEVLQVFAEQKIGCVPICDENNTPVGIITRSDIIQHFDAICSSRMKGAEC